VINEVKFWGSLTFLLDKKTQKEEVVEKTFLKGIEKSSVSCVCVLWTYYQ
jgi:hypothetical protein